MRLPRVQFTIGRLMIVVATAAGLSAWLRVPDTVAFTALALLILTPTFLALFAHIIIARPGYRLQVATWVAAFWPALFVWSIHAAWVIACGSLGHPPGPSDNGLVITVLDQSVILVMVLTILSPMICLALTLVPSEKPASAGVYARVLPLLLTPFVWLSVFAAMRWDPLGIVQWFMD
jgi:hypothetical protein